jgi:hypothetical protein
MASLLERMAAAPAGLLQSIVESALTLCYAHSSGISILEEEQDIKILRWAAVAGNGATAAGPGSHSK